MKLDVDEVKIVQELRELITLGIRQYGRFSKKFPELYWKVYVPAKIETMGKRRQRMTKDYGMLFVPKLCLLTKIYEDEEGFYVHLPKHGKQKFRIKKKVRK